MYCTNCGEETKKSICEHCGVKKNKTHLYCAWCGEPINEKATICTNCKERIKPTLLSRLGIAISVVSCAVSCWFTVSNLLNGLIISPIIFFISTILFFLISKRVVKSITHKRKGLHILRPILNISLYILAFIILIIGHGMIRQEMINYIVSHITY